MKTVRLFCDWQDSETLTKNVLKDFKESLQISKENVYKDVRFTKAEEYDVGIHLNDWGQTKPNTLNILVSFEPPELLNFYNFLPHEDGDKAFLPEVKITSTKWLNYHPTLWTLHAEIDYSNVLPSDKLNRMSWIMSNKMITPIHSKRLQLAHDIFYNSDVGRCLHYFGSAFPQYTRCANKSEGLRNFAYSIAFENSVERGVLTEKFYDCIVNNCIPITNNKTAFELFPEDAFVYVDFNQTFEQIKEQLYKLAITPITEKQDKANQQAKTEILYGKRNPVDEIFEIVNKVTC